MLAQIAIHKNTVATVQKMQKCKHLKTLSYTLLSKTRFGFTDNSNQAYAFTVEINRFSQK